MNTVDQIGQKFKMLVKFECTCMFISKLSKANHNDYNPKRKTMMTSGVTMFRPFIQDYLKDTVSVKGSKFLKKKKTKKMH
jgi:hypothetical protein